MEALRLRQRYMALAGQDFPASIARFLRRFDAAQQRWADWGGWGSQGAPGDAQGPGGRGSQGAPGDAQGPGGQSRRDSNADDDMTARQIMKGNADVMSDATFLSVFNSFISNIANRIQVTIWRP